MNKVIYCLLVLIPGACRSAASPKPLRRAYPFSVICNQSSEQITKLERKHHAVWQKACTAIMTNDSLRFKECPIADLVNKVDFITGMRLLNSVSTLLEIAIQEQPTEGGTEIIKDLLRNGAYTRTSYGISQGDIYEEHYPPIFYAVMYGNVKAFKALWFVDSKVPMEPAIALLECTDESSEKEEPTVARFLNILLLQKQSYINGLPKPDITKILEMITITMTEITASSSCSIQ